MRHRLLVTSLVALSALVLLALPATANPPSATATVSFVDNGDCNFTVTYTWSGFKGGQDFNARYGVKYAEFGNFNVAVFVNEFPVTVAGQATHEFSLAGHGTHTYYGYGRLLDTRSRILSGSDVQSSTSATLTC